MDCRHSQQSRSLMRAARGLLALGVLAGSIAAADEPPKPTANAPAGVKQMSGISILGNQDAPKSLVIVPWKSSEIGKGVAISNSLSSRATPVDKDVFGRELHYYELRSGEKRN